MKSFRNAGIDMVFDDNNLCCRVIADLARCLLNPASLQPVLIPEEIEDEPHEMNMELYVEECYDFLHGPDTPDEEDEWDDII
jgi:hypothetical protein